MAPRADAELPVDWQTQCSEVKQRGEQLLRSELWSDCTFLVGTTRVRIGAHRLLLAMASPVFEAMLFGPLAEGQDPIVIPDIEPEAFQILMDYIYTDNITINSCSIAYEVHYCAQKYMLPHLMTVCTKYLSTNVTPQNACLIYEIAQLLADENLSQMCLKVIQTNTKEVLNAPNFVQLQMDTVAKVFALEPLNIDSELDLFEAAKRYAEADESRCSEGAVTGYATMMSTASGHVIKRRRLSTETESKPKLHRQDILKEQMRTVIQNIRFLTLQPRAFANHDFTSLLSSFDILAISLNLLSADTSVPMPTGFNTIRTPRERQSREKINAGSVVAKNDVPVGAPVRPPVTQNNIQLFRTHVPNARSLKVTPNVSRQFKVRNLPCTLEMSVQRKERKQLNFYIYMYCNWEDRSSWSCQMEVEFKVLARDKKPPCTKKINCLFGTVNGASTKWGIAVINYGNLLNPQCGYVHNNTITVEAHIVARKVKRN